MRSQRTGCTYRSYGHGTHGVKIPRGPVLLEVYRFTLDGKKPKLGA